MVGRLPNTLSVAALGLLACQVGGSGSAEGGETSSSTGGTDTEGPPGPLAPADLCPAAPEIGAGRWVGSLRARGSDGGGACGLGGPDVFFRLVVPTRSDVNLQARGVAFVPRVGALPSLCGSDWESRGLLCTAGIDGWIIDAAPGAELLVSVGIDADDPALLTVPEEGPHDALYFALDVTFRDVIELGERCVPASLGRCASGTACVADEGQDTDVTGGDGGWTCEEVPADTCTLAQPLTVPLGETVVVIDPAQLQTDAHHHSCAGARMRERVFELDLPPGLAEGASFEIRVDDPGAALAVRAPDCLAAAERACAPPEAAGAELMVPTVDSLASAGIAPYLFVELPGPPDGPTGEEAPFDLVLVLEE